VNRKLLYLGPDLSDVAVIRRVGGLRAAGVDVAAYAYERSGTAPEGFCSLGPAQDGNIRARLGAIWRVVRKLRADLPELGPVSAIYVRNLDLALAALLLRRTLPRVPIIYEVLDIHPMLTAEGAKGRLARMLERRVLSACAGLVTSSPGFIETYFREIQGYDARYFLFENKVEGLDAFVVREAMRTLAIRQDPLTIVFSGKLRCIASTNLLTGLARARPETVRIRLAGSPIPEVREAYDQLTALPNVEALGRYAYPDGLEKIYAGADLNWAIDFQADFNSRELIPNRLYEGSVFGVPPIVRSGTATARRADGWGSALSLSEPYDMALLQLADAGTDGVSELKARQAAVPAAECMITDDYARLKDFIFRKY
jgi:succinoglycan biosynthesis protein ExoL